MRNKDFAGNVVYGNKAAAFVYERLDELFDLTPFLSANAENAYFEGNDIPVIFLVIDYENKEKEPETIGNRDAYPVLYAYGGIEVKGRSFNTMIARNDMDDCVHGCMDFSIWKQRDGKRATRGNLHEMFYPEHYTKANTPFAFASILCDRDDRPFCCISFNDFSAFKERMTELIRQYLGIVDFEELPVGEEAQRIKATRGKLTNNMWIIDFEWISDLATVTMIGDDPILVDRHNKCSLELQKSRLEYLKQLSKGRRIPQQRVKARSELADTMFGQSISDSVYGAMENLKKGKKPIADLRKVPVRNEAENGY